MIQTQRYNYEIRSLNERDIPAALAVHQSRWKDSHLVIDSKILEKQIQGNGKFQKGAWLEDPITKKKHLVGLVNVSRFQMAGINPKHLRVLSGESIPADYHTYAHSVNGNALGCFIISSASPALLRQLYGNEMVVNDVKRLIAGRAKRLIRAVKLEAEQDPSIRYMTAVSTPALIERRLGLASGAHANVNQVLEYLQKKGCPVLVGFHGKNGAELLKVISKKDGHVGRPVSENLGGGGVIALMLYPYGDGEKLIANRPKKLIHIQGGTVS